MILSYENEEKMDSIGDEGKENEVASFQQFLRVVELPRYRMRLRRGLACPNVLVFTFRLSVHPSVCPSIMNTPFLFCFSDSEGGTSQFEGI